MQRIVRCSLHVTPPRLALLATVNLGINTTVACVADLPDGPATLDQVTRDRQLLLHHDCWDCHSGGKGDPGDSKWLAGYILARDMLGLPFRIGPFKTYPKNLTPDNDTGLGKFTHRQIFNALRFGLNPHKTTDVVITTGTPGQGHFPAAPVYLAPPMPGPSWRHMADDELWAIVAYIKHGIRAVTNKVPNGQEPPDQWASNYTPAVIG